MPVSLADICHNDRVEGPFLFKYDISIPDLRDMIDVSEEVKSDFRADGFVIMDSHDLNRTGRPEGGATVSTAANECEKEQSSVIKEEDCISSGIVVDSLQEGCVIRMYCYGHAGDQNLHLNVVVR